MKFSDMIEAIAGYKDQLFGGNQPPEERARNRAAVSKAGGLAMEGVKPLPESTAELMATLRDPNFKIRNAVAIVESDPALAADVLQLANSAANARKAPCDDVAAAFRRLGAKAVADLAVSAHVMAIANSATGVGRDVADHCVRTATVLRCFPAFRGYSPQRLFLAGLVHDIGILLLDQTGEFKYRKEDTEMPWDGELCDRERKKLGYDHAVLGAVAVKMWEVPDPVGRVVCWHHNLEDALERGGDVAYMVSSVRLAGRWQKMVGPNRNWNDVIANNLAETTEAEFLGLTKDDIELLWEASIDGELAGAPTLVA